MDLRHRRIRRRPLKWPSKGRWQKWGIGRYLYGLSSPWVALEQKGRSWVIKKDEYPKLAALLRAYTGISAKSSAQAKRDKDFEFFKDKMDAATDLEDLGAIGREIKEALPSMPVAMRDPLHDYYAETRERLQALPNTRERAAESEYHALAAQQ